MKIRQKQHYIKIYILLIFIFNFFPSYCQQLSTNGIVLDDVSNFPVPQDESILFYVQRNSNINTIVYCANLLTDGELDPKQPIDIFWRSYTSKGEKSKLNFIQKVFAYGLKLEKKDISGYILSFRAKSNRKIKVILNENKQALALMDISQQTAKLDRIFVKVSGNRFWPNVNYIDLIGQDLKTGQLITERITP